MLKTRATELQQAVTELAMEISGTYAVPLDHSTPYPGDNFQPVGPEEADGVAQDCFNKRKVSIYAGSNEIQRNIMSKLVLGLQTSRVLNSKRSTGLLVSCAPVIAS